VVPFGDFWEQKIRILNTRIFSVGNLQLMSVGKLHFLLYPTFLNDVTLFMT